MNTSFLHLKSLWAPNPKPYGCSHLLQDLPDQAIPYPADSSGVPSSYAALTHLIREGFYPENIFDNESPDASFYLAQELLETSTAIDQYLIQVSQGQATLSQSLYPRIIATLEQKAMELEPLLPETSLVERMHMILSPINAGIRMISHIEAEDPAMELWRVAVDWSRVMASPLGGTLMVREAERLVKRAAITAYEEPSSGLEKLWNRNKKLETIFVAAPKIPKEKRHAWQVLHMGNIAFQKALTQSGQTLEAIKKGGWPSRKDGSYEMHPHPERQRTCRLVLQAAAIFQDVSDKLANNQTLDLEHELRHLA